MTFKSMLLGESNLNEASFKQVEGADNKRLKKAWQHFEDLRQAVEDEDYIGIKRAYGELYMLGGALDHGSYDEATAAAINNYFDKEYTKVLDKAEKMMDVLKQFKYWSEYPISLKRKPAKKGKVLSY